MKKRRPLWHWLLCVALLPAVLPLFLIIMAWRLAMGAAEAVDTNQ